MLISSISIRGWQIACLAYDELLIWIEKPFIRNIHHQDVIGGSTNPVDCKGVGPRCEFMPASTSCSHHSDLVVSLTLNFLMDVEQTI